MSKTKKTDFVAFLLMLSLMTVFVLGILVLTISGLKAYRSIYASNSETNQVRASVTYVTNKIKSMDNRTSFSINKVDEKDVLVFSENIDDTIYETRIYEKNQNLIEEFTVKGEPLDSDNGQIITEVESFNAEISDSNLVKIQIGGEPIYVNLWSEV